MPLPCSNMIMHNLIYWSAQLLQSLYEHGVKHLFISPGSRSTPLTIAAALHPNLHTQIVLDERSAAFMALGASKQSNVPSVLICTSGTAAANYFPAIVEAKEAGVPLIVLTADRPPNLRNLGSSQTTDQVKMYGEHAVFFHDTGEPSYDERDLKRIEYLAKQAVEKSVEYGGATHINLPFRKPLEPTENQLKETTSFYKNRSQNCSEYKRTTHGTIHLRDDILQLLNQSKKPLIITGPASPNHSLCETIKTFSERLSAPVIAEPGSSYPTTHKHSVRRFEQFLRDPDFRITNAPDLIIRFGDQPFTSSVLSALEFWKTIPLIHISTRFTDQDHTMSVLHKIICKQEHTLVTDLIHQPNRTAWLNSWLNKDDKAEDILTKTLEKEQVFTDGHVFHHLKKLSGKNWNVMISNSLPPRDMALFGASKINQFVSRGTAGIDGIISTAIGISLSSQKPTCCITGDLAFLHDSNALLSIQKTTKPFVVVVINNGGGNIFRMLPIYKKLNRYFDDEMFQTYFETPQNSSIEKLTQASGIDYRLITSPDELHDVDINSVANSIIIECKTDATASMAMRNKLWSI